MDISFRNKRKKCHKDAKSLSFTKEFCETSCLSAFVASLDMIMKMSGSIFTKSFIQRFGSVLYVQLFIYLMNVLPYRAHGNSELVSDLFV